MWIRNVHCNVEFVCQLQICSRTEGGTIVDLDRFDVWQGRFCSVGSIILDINLNVGPKLLLLLLLIVVIVCIFTFVAEFNILATERRWIFSGSSLPLYLEWRRAIGFPL